MLRAASKKSWIGLYLFFGLAFLLWENLVSSFFGIYHFELRRTFWGIIYYSLLFLFFGGLAEGLNFLYSRLCPEQRWFGQKYIWLLTILVAFLWGEAFRKLLIDLFSIYSIRLSYELNLIWLLLAAIVGWVGNIMLAKLARTGRPADPSRLGIYFNAAILYLIVSTKVTYRYFSPDIFSSQNLLLQPIFILGSLVLSLIIVRLFTSVRAFRLSLITVPVILTIAVIYLPVGYRTVIEAPEIPSQPPSNHPNIIVMLFDAMRADHVGAIAEDYSLTPNIDSLARQAKVYRSCYSTSSWTFPSLVSIMTSRLPNKLGLVNYGFLPEKVPTLADILNRNGYRTFLLSTNQYGSPRDGLARSFDEYHFRWGRGPKQLFIPFSPFCPPFPLLHELAYQFGFVSTDYHKADWREMNKCATNLLENALAKPFFLYMHFMDTHARYWSAPYTEGILDLEMLSFYSPFSVSADSCATKKIKVTVLETMHKRYMDCVRNADMAVADMMWILQKRGLNENTIVIITSDHGEEFLEHGNLYHKNTLYEESVKVPLIIHIPQELQIDLPDQPTGVSMLDLAPTILDLAGIESDILDRDGWSLLRPYPDSHRPKYMMLEVMNVSWSAVVLEPYKLILKERLKNGKVDTLLFDFSVDEGEKENLYPQEKHIADSLAVYLQYQLDQSISSPLKAPRKLTPEEIHRLRSLGYLN